jgi:L-fuculose-phosphate aldolase
MNDNRHAAEDCLKAAKLLYARGMVNAYEGNVSVRLGETILITPSAVCKEELEPEDLVEVDIQTGRTILAKPGRVASSEMKMHLCVYRSRPDVLGVAHAHPPFATAYAVAGKPIESVGYPEMRILYDRIPVCRYGRPSTEDINVDIPEILKTHDAFLLENHGLVCAAGSAIEAAYKLEGVESIAKVLTLSKLHGGEKPLPDDELQATHDLYLHRRGIL